LREDVIIKRLDSLEELIKANIDEIKKLYEHQTKILEKLDEHGKTLEDHKREISSLHGEMQGVRQGLEDNKRELSSLQSEVQGVQQTLEDHKKELSSLHNEIQGVRQELKDHESKVENVLQDHTQKLTAIQKSIKRLQHEVGTYTSRSGLKLEKAVRELYKKALELHGIDPSRVQHGEIVDEKGVIGRKGSKYEVDFYEVADNEVYVFEVKTKGDIAAVEQLLVRRLLFESLGKRVSRKFLVCNVIDKKAKEFAEQNDITVIAGSVV